MHWRDRLDELRLAIMLLTRLPMGTSPAVAQLPSTVWAYPLVGAGIGLLAGLVLMLAQPLSPTVAALLAVATAVLLTGGLHEDGLADMADGLCGGRDRQHRLDIMRDSRIGTYGALALILGVGLRTAALVALASPLPALVVAGALSRSCMVALIATLRPARTDGLGILAANPARSTVLGAFALAALPAFALLGLAGIEPITVAVAITAATGLMARRLLDGYTGDVLGAVQQLVEIGALLAILALQ